MANYIHRAYSTTTNYIELNYIPQSNTRVECKFTIGQNLKTDNYFFGCGSSYNSRDAFKFNICKGRNQFSYYVGGTFNDYAGSFTMGETYTVSLSTTAFVVNGVSTAISSNYSPGSYNFTIGRGSGDGYQEFMPAFDIYYFKLYEGDTLVYNFVPAKNNNGYGCLKDTLTNTLYDFTNPSGIEFVSNFSIEPSSKSFKASGGTQSIVISADNPWTATTDLDWVSLSSYSGESGTTVTLTVPSYTGSAKRQGTITFTCSGESETFTVKQNPPSSGSDTIRLGENALLGMYLGNSQIESAYIGETQFWTNGPFTGLTFTKEKTFVASGGSATLKVKSGLDDWTITCDADWLSFSQQSGTTGTTEITVTCSAYTSETENRTAIITASTSSITKTCTITQKKVVTVPPNNQIWYKTNDSSLLTFKSGLGVNLVSNTYTDGLGVATFDGNLTQLPAYYFQSNTKLTDIWLPNSLVSLGAYSLHGIPTLTAFTSNADFTLIGHETFWKANFQSVHIKSVVTMGFWTFVVCSAITSIVFDDMSTCTRWEEGINQELPSYGVYGPLWGCESLTELRMPGMTRSFSIVPTALNRQAIVTLFGDLGHVVNKTIWIESSAYATLTEEDKAIATTKGWAVVAHSRG